MSSYEIFVEPVSSGCKGRANLTLFMYIWNQNTIYYLQSKERNNNRFYSLTFRNRLCNTLNHATQGFHTAEI